MTDDLTIREMADMYDVTLRLLRFYEEKELIFPRRSGQHRFYTKRDQARLKLLLRGKTFGFSLEEMRCLLNMYDTGQKDQQMIQTVTLAKQKLNALKKQRMAIGDTIVDLEDCIATAISELDPPMAFSNVSSF